MHAHVALSLFLASIAGAEQSPQCPTPTADASDIAQSARRHPRLHDAARVLVGVDVLGRVVVAIDSDRNGAADAYVKFTDEKRLQGPWSQLLERAHVESTSGTLQIRADDLSLGVALSVSGAEPPPLPRHKKFRRTLISSTGVELIRTDAGKGTALSALDVNSVHTWPETFWHDTLAPGTLSPVCNCDSEGCHAGGCGATACALPAPDSTGCEVHCAGGRSFFACCKRRFLQTAQCRCVRYSRSCWF